ncbi:unnamed protein product [Prunus armeniaca]
MEIEHETFCIQKAIDMIFPMDKYGIVYLIEVYHQVKKLNEMDVQVVHATCPVWCALHRVQSDEQYARLSEYDKGHQNYCQ